MFEDALYRHAVGPTPDKLAPPGGGSLTDAHAKTDIVAGEIPQEASERAKCLKLLEDEPHHLLHLLVWVQPDLPIWPPDVAGWQGEGECAAARLAQTALIQPLLEQMQLRLRHGALEAQQQSVIVPRRVVEPVQVSDEGAKQGAHFEQAVPVSIRAGQARHLDAENEAHVPEADLRDQPVEAGPASRAGAGLPQVVVNDQHALGRPAERLSPRHQAVLQPGRFLVGEHLLRRGLADVDDGEALTMPGA